LNLRPSGYEPEQARCSQLVATDHSRFEQDISCPRLGLP